MSFPLGILIAKTLIRGKNNFHSTLKHFLLSVEILFIYSHGHNIETAEHIMSKVL